MAGEQRNKISHLHHYSFNLMKYISNVLGHIAIVLTLAFGLQGCGTPIFLTKTYDQSYQVQSSDLDVMWLGVGKLWGSDERLIETMRFNGINARIIPDSRYRGESLSDYLTRIQGTSPILVFTLEIMSFRGSSISNTVQAKLYPTGKQVPVWISSISLQAKGSSDIISLAVLNELAHLKLLKVNRQPAETADGKRSYYDCHPLPILKPGQSVPNFRCDQILK